jgi:beta-glucanase (GH16 family)
VNNQYEPFHRFGKSILKTKHILLLLVTATLGGMILFSQRGQASSIQAQNYTVYIPLLKAGNFDSPAPTASRTPVATHTPTPTQTPIPTQTPGGEPTPLGQPGNWKLIFNDEFNGTSLDTSVWNTCFPWARQDRCTNSGNHELELFQPQEAYLDGSGHLVLRAEEQQINGFDYTSGMVASYRSLNFKYGYVEARVKIPAGKGLWPQFWMMPSDRSWPPEIDIFEILGDDPTRAYFTYHWGSSNNTSQYSYSGPDFSAGWHTFAAKWEPGEITWYTDGIERGKFTDSVVTSKSMYLILDLSVGGDWPGPPDSTTDFPSYWQIEYVRVWQ